MHLDIKLHNYSRIDNPSCITIKHPFSILYFILLHHIPCFMLQSPSRIDIFFFILPKQNRTVTFSRHRYMLLK